jgi:lipoate-protein ligase A
VILKDISFLSPRENLLFDDCLLSLADQGEGGQVLRFWESPTVFIVLGRIGREQDDVDMARAYADGIPILRRSSGGGTVIQAPGCLNYSLILSKQNNPALNDLRRSYEWISAQIIEALQTLGVDAYFRPTSDIATGPLEHKFSGNAQKRGRQHILHHGTILYNLDLELVPKYLKMPKDLPVYRQGRWHSDFVMNIAIDPQAFKKALADVFKIPFAPQPLSSIEISALKNLLK